MPKQPLMYLHDVYGGTSTQRLLHGVNLTVRHGELHFLMGPNGAGKSTLAALLAGAPDYILTQGTMQLQGQDLAKMAPEERAAAGLFVAFQNPIAVSGVSVFNFLKTAIICLHKTRQQPPPSMGEILKNIRTKADMLGIAQKMLRRDLNSDFSGGEKKKMELLQLAVLEPKLAILDETDSGLDVDALLTLGEMLQQLRTSCNAFVVITHNPNFSRYLKPDTVQILYQGRILCQGKEELATKLLEGGYEKIIPHL